jgi:D-2-hydroxyacid dehydrogenase (NADP+)
MLNLARQAPRLWENQKQRRWERWTFTRLAGKTLVIVGVGSIAGALAPRCKALDMKVLGVSGTPRELPGFDRIYPKSQLVEAAAKADFMVILAPLTPENAKLIDSRVFAAMKPSAFFINIARGEVCDEEALIEALRSKRLAGAGLDVFTTIPLPPENPLWGMENVLISPQLAGSSEVNKLLNLPILETNTRCFLEGRWSDMINRVSR